MGWMQQPGSVQLRSPCYKEPASRQTGPLQLGGRWHCLGVGARSDISTAAIPGGQDPLALWLVLQTCTAEWLTSMGRAHPCGLSLGTWHSMGTEILAKLAPNEGVCGHAHVAAAREPEPLFIYVYV